jgi:hypothetical protein
MTAYTQSDATFRMEERIDDLDREVTRLAASQNNVSKLESVLDETKQQVQSLNLHLGKMQAATETYSKILGVLLAFTSVLIPIGFTIVGSNISTFNSKLDAVSKLSSDAAHRQEINELNVKMLKDELESYVQKKKTP